MFQLFIFLILPPEVDVVGWSGKSEIWISICAIYKGKREELTH